MTQAADGRPSFAVSIHPGVAGGPPVVEKRGLDPRSAALLSHERAVLSHLSHPNIIELARRTPTASDDTNTVVTFLAGRTTLADHPPTEPAAIVRTAAQLAATLAELHELGWAHGAISAGHLIVGAEGSIVWCSFRRATPTAQPDSPAARSDVDALVEVIHALLPTAAPANGSIRRLVAVVASARNRTPTARHLAEEIAGALGDNRGAGVHRRRPRHQPALAPTSRRRPAPRGRRHARRSPVPGVTARLAVCALAAAVLWRLEPGAQGSIASTDQMAQGLRVAVEVLRWAALVASIYGLAINGLTLAALVSRSKQLSDAAGRLGPSILRQWATGITSIGVLGTAIASAAASAPSPAAHVVVTPEHHDAPTTTLEPSTTTAPPPTTTLAAPTSSAHPSVGAAASGTAGPAMPSTARILPTWITAPGDDLWHIAEHTLTRAWNRRPTNREVADYWQRLLAANRGQLVDPDQPDLIYPGQVFDLPPLS